MLHNQRQDAMSLESEQVPADVSKDMEPLSGEEVNNLFEMARQIAFKYARRYNRDDCISVAFAATVVALSKVPNGPPGTVDLIAWVAAAVHNKVRRFIMFDTLIRNKSRKKENFVVVHPIGNNDPYYKPPKSFVRDLIDDAIQDEIDRTIVNLRIEEYDDAEIGSIIGKSRSYVQQRRSDLHVRYQKLYSKS